MNLNRIIILLAFYFSVNICFAQTLITNANFQSHFANDTTSNEFQEWKKMAVTKLQKQNASTKNYDTFILMNPGKYIQIKNEKDVRIEDLDVFSMVFGSEFVGLYNVGEFINGERTTTNVPQTIAYKGDMVLRNSSGDQKSAETYVFFFYSGSKLGAIEIRTRLCNCATIIFIDDYTGIKILN